MSVPMSPARLAALVEAYGARAERWPEAERAAATALLARSPEARARLAEATALDALLDAAPAARPAPGLAERVLAAAPRRGTLLRLPPRGRARSLVAATASMAAAAGLAFWLVQTTPAPLTPEAVAQLGVLDVPTDDLLSAADLGLAYEAPAFGCDDPMLGCDDLEEPAPARESQGALHEKEMTA